jgi:UDP:flavonoid glycosyltransferase YjiC (YdhE family)
VPLVIAGSSEDKPEVIARLRRTGAAIDLGTATPEPEAIRVAVLRVLSDRSFRAAASEMAQQAVEAGGAVKAAERIEALIQSS